MFALLVFILCYFLILLYNFPETLSNLNQYIQYFSQKHQATLLLLLYSKYIFCNYKFFTFLLYTIQYTITNCRSQITATFSSSCYYNWHITLAYNFLCLDHIYKTYRHSNYKYRFYSVFFY